MINKSRRFLGTCCAALFLFTGTAAFAAEVPLYTNETLFKKRMEEVGCADRPQATNGWTPTGHTINVFRFYCKGNDKLEWSLHPEKNTPIKALIDKGRVDWWTPSLAILALRAVPENQRAQRNRIAQSAAIDLARIAVEWAYPPHVNKHPFAAESYRKLTAWLDELPTASRARRENIHYEAYELRLTLERRNFLYKFNQAAYAVAMAASTGDPGRLGFPPGKSADTAWISLYMAAKALDSTLVYGHIYDERDKARADAERIIQDVLRKYL